jgi:hypothetical protein
MEPIDASMVATNGLIVPTAVAAAVTVGTRVGVFVAEGRIGEATTVSIESETVV